MMSVMSELANTLRAQTLRHLIDLIDDCDLRPPQALAVYEMPDRGTLTVTITLPNDSVADVQHWAKVLGLHDPYVMDITGHPWVSYRAESDIPTPIDGVQMITVWSAIYDLTALP